MNLRDYICEWLGCKKNYSELQKELDKCCYALTEAHETIRQLELLVPQPTPPKIDYIVEKDTAWVQAELDSLGLQIIRLPLDGNYRLTNRKNFMNIVAWDAIDRIQYVTNYFDCDKFALMFKVQVNLIFNITQVAAIIDYQSGHAYNLILFPNTEPMVFEPQTDGIWVWTKRIKDFYSLEGAIALI